ncbi:HTH-type transcriptional repressor ComR [Streptomyces sp. MBT84]|uniref:TetR/AcrR family transcriptional regulator n=1 Tax=unclassified Streptomyces TaxID=2593676 RepID=UPI001C6E8D3F|nr:TetR/AcrR family transcriptional regulator [Streptomyces sp. MBT84]MBW8700966.1 HTH-type transcriptional repressor ComR [Streptomyces sp. MBT84]
MGNSREKELRSGPAPAAGRGRSVGRPRGRPRSFDREAALEKAVLAFWERGYEATSVADLTQVMGIGAPSLYAAFGDKRSLFEEAVGVYCDRYGSFVERALAEEPTVRGAFRRILDEAADLYTAAGHPHGCLVIHAATNCTTPEVEELLRVRRNEDVAAFESRVRAGVAAGELDSGTDARALARYARAIIQGMSQQARDGASRGELEALADMAMANWPRVRAEDGYSAGEPSGDVR